jgi:hypothetical protein
MNIGLVCISGGSQKWWVVCCDVNAHGLALCHPGRDVLPLCGFYVPHPNDRLSLVGGDKGAGVEFEAWMTFGESLHLIADGVPVNWDHRNLYDDDDDGDEYELARPERIAATHRC